MAERKLIEHENQRKLDDYQALLKKGQDNVKDLNLRFGDWYFVVNDDVFRKIRLSSDKVVKKKEKKGRKRRPRAGTARRPPGSRDCRRFLARASGPCRFLQSVKISPAFMHCIVNNATRYLIRRRPFRAATRWCKYPCCGRR